MEGRGNKVSSTIGDMVGKQSMKKIPFAVLPFSLILVGIVLACNFLIPQKPFEQTPTPSVTLQSPTPTETLTPTPTSTPTSIPPTDTSVPTRTSIPTLVTYSTPVMAPFCDDAEVVAQSACEYPIARQSGAFCINKSPYNLIALSDRATYELLHEHVQCEEAGVKDGQRNVICTGPMAYYFELRVCDSACTSLRVEPDLDRCPFGYAYNNLQNCCTKEIQEVAQGCTVLKLRTKSCTIDCGQFKTSKTCTDYGYACRWNYEISACQLRK